MKVFDQFICKRLCLHHSFNDLKPSLNDDITDTIVLPLKSNVVSSANSFVKISFKKNGKSFIKIMNNNGPKTDPCGTPRSISTKFER